MSRISGFYWTVSPPLLFSKTNNYWRILYHSRSLIWSYQGYVPPIKLETVAKDDHVGDIERNIRHLKEGIRGTIQSLPYHKYPRIMIEHIAEDTIKPKKFLPANDSISPNVGSLTIVLGRGPPYYNDMTIEFGSYAQVFEDNQITNTPDPYMGSYCACFFSRWKQKIPFMNLNSGRVLCRQKFTILPITDWVIQRVHALAANDKQSAIVWAALYLNSALDTPSPRLHPILNPLFSPTRTMKSNRSPPSLPLMMALSSHHLLLTIDNPTNDLLPDNLLMAPFYLPPLSIKLLLISYPLLLTIHLMSPLRITFLTMITIPLLLLFLRLMP